MAEHQAASTTSRPRPNLPKRDQAHRRCGSAPLPASSAFQRARCANLAPGPMPFLLGMSSRQALLKAKELREPTDYLHGAFVQRADDVKLPTDREETLSRQLDATNSQLRDAQNDMHHQQRRAEAAEEEVLMLQRGNDDFVFELDDMAVAARRLQENNDRLAYNAEAAAEEVQRLQAFNEAAVEEIERLRAGMARLKAGNGYLRSEFHELYKQTKLL